MAIYTCSNFIKTYFFDFNILRKSILLWIRKSIQVSVPEILQFHLAGQSYQRLAFLQIPKLEIFVHKLRADSVYLNNFKK